MSSKDCNILELFKDEPKEPFSLNIQMFGNKLKTEHIFNNLKSLYAKGLLIQNGENMNPKINKIQINKVKKEHINIMKRHMLSLGIDVKYSSYSEENKDCLYRELLYDIQHIDGIIIKATLDWKKNVIDELKISFSKEKMTWNSVKKMENIVRKHYEANHFLKLLEPKNLRDYSIKINTPDNLIHVISFDFAKHVDDFRKKLVASYKIEN